MASRRSDAHWLNRDFAGVPGWGLVVSALIVAAVGVLLFWKSTQPEPTTSWTPVARESATPEPSETVAPLSVVFIGDSYTGSTGASEIELGWAPVLADMLGWDAEYLAIGGSGYINPGNGDSTYLDRAQAAIDADPGLVIVSGGRNDQYYDPADVGAAASSLYAELRSGLPGVEIVVLAPWWDASEPPAAYADVREAIISAASAADVTLVDSGEPLAGMPDLITDDGVHPNDSGHAVLADSVASAFDEVGIPH